MNVTFSCALLVFSLGLYSGCDGGSTPADKPVKSEKASAEKSAELAANKDAADKAAANKAAADKAAADKVAADKVAADKVAADKATADKVAADKAAAPPTGGACPKEGYPCESGYACECFTNSAGQIVRHEAKKKKTGALTAVTTYLFDDNGLLVSSEEDGAIWDKKAKVDGKADTVWRYTYDADKNRLQHEVFDGAGKSTAVCKYKSCPPPYDSTVCYEDLKCKDT